MVSFSKHRQRADVKPLTMSALPVMMPIPLPAPEEAAEVALLLDESTHQPGDAFANIFGAARGTGETKDQASAREFESSDLPSLLRELRSRDNHAALEKALSRLDAAWEDERLNSLKHTVCEEMWRRMVTIDVTYRTVDYNSLHLTEDSPVTAPPTRIFSPTTFAYVPEYNHPHRTAQAGKYIQSELHLQRKHAASEHRPLNHENVSVVVAAIYYQDLALRMASQAVSDPESVLKGVFGSWRMSEILRSHGRRSLGSCGRKQLPSLSHAQWEHILTDWLMAPRGPASSQEGDDRKRDLQLAVREELDHAA